MITIQRCLVEDGYLTLGTIDVEANVGQPGNDVLEVRQHFRGFIPKRCVVEVPDIEH